MEGPRDSGSKAGIQDTAAGTSEKVQVSVNGPKLREGLLKATQVRTFFSLALLCFPGGQAVSPGLGW